jgi:hypothetical protein
MWRRVDLVWTDVSEERIASIFRVQKSVSEEPAWAGGCSSRWFHAHGFFYGGLESVKISNSVIIICSYNQDKAKLSLCLTN